MKLVVSLLITALLLALLPVPAQDKPTPTGDRKVRPRGARRQLPEQRAESLDIGDFYLIPDGKRALHRLAGTVVVQVNERSDKAATVNTLVRSGAALDGYSVDFESSAGFTVLKAGANERQRHLSQPKLLQETIANTRKTA